MDKVLIIENNFTSLLYNCTVTIAAKFNMEKYTLTATSKMVHRYLL